MTKAINGILQILYRRLIVIHRVNDIQLLMFILCDRLSFSGSNKSRYVGHIHTQIQKAQLQRAISHKNSTDYEVRMVDIKMVTTNNKTIVCSSVVAIFFLFAIRFISKHEKNTV